jgi:hypothetical protein
MAKNPYHFRLGKIAIIAALSIHSALQLPIALAAPTITTLDSSIDTGHFSSIAIGSDNLPIISYIDTGDGYLKVVHCGNNNCSSGNTFTNVDTSGTAGGQTAITIGADSLPIISYYDIASESLNVAHCGNASCSSGNIITTVDSGQVGKRSSIALGADSLPIISYTDDFNRDLKVAHCGNNSCSSGNTLTTVDSTNQVGFPNDITIGSDNLPIIDYYDNTTQQIMVAHCGNNTCSASNTITAIDSAATGIKISIDVYLSIAIGADNLAVLAYNDTVPDTLKVAHCGNTACSSGNSTTTVDSTTFVSLGVSIAKGNDNLPVISYYDQTNGDLKVAHCGNNDCSSGNTLTSVDTTDDVGAQSAITIAADTFPSISYLDVGNSDLKYAHCDNYLCDLSGGGGGSNDAPFFSPWSLALLGVGIFVYLKREQLLFTS